MNALVPPESGRNANDGAAEMIRRYRAWEGSNKFCLGGRFIFGPDVRSIFLTIFLIVAPAAIFCVFVARKIRDDFSGIWGNSIMVVFIVFTLYRNYRFFFMFVFSATLLCLYVHGFCWVYIKKILDSENCSIWKAMSKTPASIVLIIYTFLALWFVGGLSVFHLYLISTNQSTYENFRYQYSRRSNPYNRGIVRNFLEVFCSSIPTSKNDFRAKVPTNTGMQSYPVGSDFMRANLASAREEQAKPIWGENRDRDYAMGSGQ